MVAGVESLKIEEPLHTNKPNEAKIINNLEKSKIQNNPSPPKNANSDSSDLDCEYTA